jgi:mandelate racemase
MQPGALTVSEVRARPLIAPLRTPIITASGQLPHAPLLLIDVHTKEGLTGRCYLASYNPVALKALAQLVGDLGKIITGDKVVPLDLEAKMRAQFTLLGGSRGLAGLAISGLDMALWDIAAQSHNVPLATLLGSKPRPLRAYNSMGMIRADKAEAEARKTLDAGFTGIKFKLGFPTLAEDLAVVHAFRRALPDDFSIMVDFNQSLTVAEAIRRGRALEHENLAWIEEPIRCDDYAGAAKIAAALDTPLQLGENFSGAFDMHTALVANACDFVMPDAQQIGGVTGWLRAADLAQAYSKDFSSHLFVEVSAHLLAVTPTFHWLEYLDIAGAVLAEPPQVVNGTIAASERSGIGMTWDEAAVKKYQQA